MDGAYEWLSIPSSKRVSLEKKKMKKFLLGTVALVAVGATVPALAADLPARTYTKAPAYAPAPIYNWTGFYIGGHIRGAFNGSHRFRAAPNSRHKRPFLRGLRIAA